jgi:hypothetical protein
MLRNPACCSVALLLVLLTGLNLAVPTESRAGILSDTRSATRGRSSNETQTSDDSGQLDKARGQARRSAPASQDHSSGHRESHRRSRNHHRHGHGGGSHFGFHIFRSAPAPVIIERRYVVPEYAPSAPVETLLQPTPPVDVFLSYPYEDDFDSYIIKTHRPTEDGDASARLWLEGGLEVDNVGRGSAGFLVQGIEGFGLDTHWNIYTEDLPVGETDRLRIGDFNLHYRIAESEDMHWRIGIGVNWLKDVVDTDYGINFTVGMDWFPAKPIVVSSEIDWGTVGTAETFHGRVTAGVLLERAELFGGYDYRTIGNVSLRGPIVGMRLWF